MIQKNFTEYSSEDFAAEPLFIKWVQQPNDEEIGNFWQIWLAKNPNKVIEVKEARSLIRMTSSQFEELDTNEVNSLWKRIQTSVTYLPRINNIQSVTSSQVVLWSLAIVVGTALLLWIVFNYQ